MNKEDECIICLDIIKSLDYAILSCNHLIHYNCLEKWLNKKKDFVNICPLCNTPGEIVNIIEVPKNIDNKPQKYVMILEELQEEPICCCNIL